MKNMTLLLTGLVVSFLNTAHATPTTPGGELLPLGWNIQRAINWMPQWTYVDAMKSARSWVSGQLWGGAWDTGHVAQFEFDENGYPLNVPIAVAGVAEPQYLKTMVLNAGYPAGQYVFLYDGEGEFRFQRATVVSEETGRIVLDFTAEQGGIIFTILETNVENYARNMRLIMPGFGNTYEENPYHPLFVERMTGISSIRFKEFNNIDQTSVVTWDERPRPNNYTQGSIDGVALELQIEMANDLNVTPWFNVPHLADDDYVANMAALILETLDADKSLYLEFSNELWNGIFPQAQWVRSVGCTDPDTVVPYTTGTDWGIYNCDDTISAIRMQLKRSFEIFRIFRDVFGDESDRIIEVLAGWSPNAWHAEQLLTALWDDTLNPTGIVPDAFAIAPYFCGPTANELYDQGLVASTTVDELLDMCEEDINSRIATDVAEIKALTEVYGLDMIAYEGGQHLAANYSARNDEALVNLLIDANRSPRMRDLYNSYADMWFENGGGLLQYWVSYAAPSQYGSWGLLESQDQPVAEAPKYLAFLDTMERLESGEIPYPLPEVQPMCGDGNLDVGEACDDGNTNSNDGCSSACALETVDEHPSGSDEFNTSASLVHWTDAYPELYENLVVEDGWLRIHPVGNNAWYQNGHGALLYKLVQNDFVVEASLNVHDLENHDSPPTGPWSAGGLLVRDPATANTNQENWLMYNVGYQGNNGVQAATVGTERKSTVNGQSLLRYGEGSHRARLRICRMGDTFRLFRMFEGEAVWTEEPATNLNPMGPINPDSPMERADLPEELQVGFMAHAYSANNNVEVDFDYFRFLDVPSSAADCN